MPTRSRRALPSRCVRSTATPSTCASTFPTSRPTRSATRSPRWARWWPACAERSVVEALERLGHGRTLRREPGTALEQLGRGFRQRGDGPTLARRDLVVQRPVHEQTDLVATNVEDTA